MINFDIRSDECYFDYLSVFAYHIENILRDKKIYFYNDIELMQGNVSYDEIIERIKQIEELTDESGFVLNEIDSKELFQDSLEWLIYWYGIYTIVKQD